MCAVEEQVERDNGCYRWQHAEREDPHCHGGARPRMKVHQSECCKAGKQHRYDRRPAGEQQAVAEEVAVSVIAEQSDVVVDRRSEEECRPQTGKLARRLERGQRHPGDRKYPDGEDHKDRNVRPGSAARLGRHRGVAPAMPRPRVITRTRMVMITVITSSRTSDSAEASPIAKFLKASDQISTGRVSVADPGPPVVVPTMTSNRRKRSISRSRSTITSTWRSIGMVMKTVCLKMFVPSSSAAS